MKHVWLVPVSVLLILGGLGCGNETAPKDSADKSESEQPSGENKNAGPKSLEEAPGLKGITDPRARNKAKLSRTNLKMIGLNCESLKYYQYVYPFPAGSDYVPENQRGNLSWRVWLILHMSDSFPEMNLRELFGKFNLNEPWDSDQNKALLEQMPEFFRLSDEAKVGYTQFVAPSGPGFIVDWPERKMPIRVTDDPSTTILLVSVKPEYAEPWTKPGGVEIDPQNASGILGGDPNGFLAYFADGSIKTLDPKMDPEMLKALLTVDGGEQIDLSKLPDNDIPPSEQPTEMEEGASTSGPPAD